MFAGFRTAMATAGTIVIAMGALSGAEVAQAASAKAAAEGSYNIKVDANATINADYCLLTTTSGNARAACSGNKWRSSFRLGAPYNPGDRVWMDINIVAGSDRKGIDLQGKRMITVRGDLAEVRVCGWNNEADYLAGRPARVLHGTSC
ncbi:hypothetical protein OG889_20455 [Streptomyces sp. NBC_00481]|uniref:hypothetical protein n=1 Tax=unclassified Streptomyces TaxID=2593676 RepID=UPI002DDB52B4|nr:MULTISPECIES: hypothetical protein [unclassified Streptomyces]WRY96898.1 hypothetical protein OG889_20455 [Streptomyces sp. NBC_00481]